MTWLKISSFAEFQNMHLKEQLINTVRQTQARKFVMKVAYELKWILSRFDAFNVKHYLRVVKHLLYIHILHWLDSNNDGI